MYKAAHGVGTYQSEQPQNNQDNSDCVEHDIPLYDRLSMTLPDVCLMSASVTFSPGSLSSFSRRQIQPLPHLPPFHVPEVLFASFTPLPFCAHCSGRQGKPAPRNLLRLKSIPCNWLCSSGFIDQQRSAKLNMTSVDTRPVASPTRQSASRPPPCQCRRIPGSFQPVGLVYRQLHRFGRR